MANNCHIEIRFDAEGFGKELMHRLALTSGTQEDYLRIAMEILDEGKFTHIGPEIDILDAQTIE